MAEMIEGVEQEDHGEFNDEDTRSGCLIENAFPYW
jgi:hypothetical protein